MKSYVLKKTAGSSLNDIYQAIKQDGKFVVYPYCVSIIALTFRLMSPPHFIKPYEATSKYRRKYTVYSLLFGWWGIPSGPIYTTEALLFHKRNKGELDITEEVLKKLKSTYSDRNINEPFERDIVIEYNREELVRIAPKGNHV